MLCFYYFVPVKERSIAISLSVCLCVCLSVCMCVGLSVSGTAGPIFTKVVAQISCGRGSVLLWPRCDMLCTSGFMDDVTFGRNGRDAETLTTAMSGVAIPGRSLSRVSHFICYELLALVTVDF